MSNLKDFRKRSMENRFFMKTTQKVLLVVSALLFQFCPSGANAVQQTFTLTDANSSVVIDNTSAERGMNNWLVDGTAQLFKQWFWFRSGSTGPENPLNTLTLLSANQATPSTLNTLYGNNNFTIQVTYSLLGGASGSGSADIGEQIKISNIGNSALSFHFFQYTDFDLGGSFAGDTAALGKNLQGLFNELQQTKGNSHFADVVITPGANHGSVALSPVLFQLLSNPNPDTLDDNAGPVTGDATSAFQWDTVIGAGGSFSISIDKSVTPVGVPEPATWALVPMGLVIFGMVRRYRSSSK